MNLSGTGPALRVAQTGVGAGYPVADFYDNDVSTTVPALRIADGGNVGIGTDTPLQKLHVQGNLLVSDTIQGSMLRPQKTLAPSTAAWPATVNSADSKILFYDNTGVNWSGLGVASDGRLWIRTGTTSENLFVLTNNGSVGIGTTLAFEKLHVQGSVLATTQHLGPSTDTVTAPGFSWSGDTSTGIYRPAHDAVGVVTGSSERLRVDSTAVSIGGFSVLNNTDSDKSTSAYLWDGASPYTTSYSTLFLRKDNSSATINGSQPALSLMNGHGGNNTTTQIAFLSAEATTGQNNNTVTIAGIVAEKASGTAGGWARGNLHIYTKNMGTKVDALSVLWNGFVGIGITNPSFRLHIVDSSYASTKIESTISSSPGQLLVWNSSYANGGTGIQIRSKHQSGASVADNHIFTWNGTGIDSLFINEAIYVVGGKVGIKNASPAYSLDVSGTVGVNMTSGFYNNQGTGTYTGTWNISAKFESYIWATGGLVTASDARIKTNIQDINDEQALTIVRLLKPKTYEYIDKVQRGSEPVIGFIAQEVAEVLPRAVSKTVEVVPSIYAMASSSAGLISLTKEHELNLNDRVMLIIKERGEVKTTVSEVVDSLSFKVEEHVSDGDVFIYGKEVTDFNTLDKNAIFTIGVAAIQELDRELQALKARIAALESL
jgi:hypothetical protein